MAIEEKALRMPKKIKPGDTLGVVAPSMPVKPEEKEKLTAYLQDAGYRVKLGKTVKELSSFMAIWPEIRGYVRRMSIRCLQIRRWTESSVPVADTAAAK